MGSDDRSEEDRPGDTDGADSADDEQAEDGGRDGARKPKRAGSSRTRRKGGSESKGRSKGRGKSKGALQPTRRTVLLALAGGFLVGGGAGFGGGYLVGKRRRRRRPRPPARPAYVPLAAHSPRKGPNPAKVTIVEFSDFECPYCGKAQSAVMELLRQFPDDVALVFMHLPLPFHKQAKGAAIAMLAAGRQGKAWELHDLMFENRQALTRVDLSGYAERLELDVGAFEQALDDPELAAQVEADLAAARKAGVGSTPSFFINGLPIRGALPLNVFVSKFKEELAEAKAMLGRGVPLEQVYEQRAKALEKQGPTK